MSAKRNFSGMQSIGKKNCMPVEKRFLSKRKNVYRANTIDAFFHGIVYKGGRYGTDKQG